MVRAFKLPDAGVLLHLNNVSGGVLSGDRLGLDIEVEAGAAAQITTTGATRLYRHRAGTGDSEQRTRFSVEDGGQLEYLPDAVIPYAGARHTQRTEIHLGRGAALFWWEILAPGRQAAGECFRFERLQIQTAVYAAARPILREDFLLEPAQKELTAMARMWRYSYMASLCAAREGYPPSFWRQLEECLNESARKQTRPGQAVWAASALVSDGIVVRGLGSSSRFLSEPLVEFWRIARRAITGKDAVPPRKTY